MLWYLLVPALFVAVLVGFMIRRDARRPTSHMPGQRSENFGVQDPKSLSRSLDMFRQGGGI